MPDARRPRRPAAVLWDMDGTLVDTERLWDVSLADLAVHLGGLLTPATRAAMIGTDMATTLDMMFTEVGLAADPVRRDDAEAWLLRRTTELYSAGVVWRPGAREAMELLHATGLPAALVTSTPRGLTELVLDAVGRENFQATVCGDEVGRTKPHPEPFLRAARLLGVPAADCLAIEDSPSGAASAEAAGCVVLVVPSETTVPSGPRRTIRPSLVGLTPAEASRLMGTVTPDLRVEPSV
jgi:HAD superfamily hydrolase (TIGR01509 family)